MTILGKSTQTLPTFEARDIGGTWDIVMRIPHVSGHGATVEQIIIIAENCGVAPEEATIARRVEALLNMSTHIDTEDLFIKGATLKLQTFSERMAAQSGCEVVRPAIDPDSEQDLRDTCDSMRRALNRLGKRFGMTSSHPDMVVNNAIECADKNEASARQVAETLADRTTRLDKTTSQLEHIEKLLIEHEHHAEGVELWASVDKLIDRVQVLEDEEGSNLVNVSRALDEAREANKETAGQLAKADQELATTRGNLHLVGQALKDNGTYPTIVELAHARMEDLKDLSSSALQAKQECANRAAVIDELNEFKTRALVLHDNICDLLGDSRDPGDELLPFAVLFTRLQKAFWEPRTAWLSLADNYELERDEKTWDAARTAVYHLMKGLSVAQHKADQSIRTVLEERNADRSIIGAVDDLLGDQSRPAAPLVAAVGALVRSHLIATKNN